MMLHQDRTHQLTATLGIFWTVVKEQSFVAGVALARGKLVQREGSALDGEPSMKVSLVDPVPDRPPMIVAEEVVSITPVTGLRSVVNLPDHGR